MCVKNKIFLFREIVLCVLLLLLASNVFSQITVSGNVTDENNRTLPGATVQIADSYLVAISDIAGEYKIQKLKKGNYVFVVSFLGYEPIRKVVSIDKDKIINFRLKETAILTEEVLVVATRAGNKMPITLTNIGRKSIERQNTGQDIPYQLSLTPSLVTSSEAGNGVGYSALRIRGTDASRINVTINGVPLNDSESQGVFWVNMPDFASSVDNIQIQRGVGTSTNGAAAFGATINFQTEKINKNPYAEMQSVAGSFNTFRNTFKAGTGLIDNKFTFDARYSKLKSDGFVDRAFSDHESYFLSGTYYAEKSIVKMNVISGNQKTGISWWGNDKMEKYGRKYNPAGKYKDDNGNVHFYDNQTDNYKQTHYQLFYSQELNTSLNMNVALHYTQGEGYYEQYKTGESYQEYGLKEPNYGTTSVTSTDLIRQKWLENDFYGFTYSLNYRKNNVKASAGGAWNYYDGDHFGDVIWAKNGGIKKNYQWYFNTGKKTDYNAFAKVNLGLNSKINIFGDLQYRHINYVMDGKDDDLKQIEQEHNFNFFNPKAGIFYTINDKNTAYASFGIAQREPTRTNYTDAKEDLAKLPNAEKLFDYELGYNYKSRKIALGVNMYYMYYKDQLVSTGERNNVGSPIMTNVDKSYRMGIELVGGVQLFEQLKWDANITLSQNKIKGYIDHVGVVDKNWTEVEVKTVDLGDTDISYSPNVVASSNISWNIIKGLTADFTSKYVGKQYFDNTSNEDRKIDAYFVNNLRVQYTLHPKWMRELSFSLQVNNIFDVAYENNAYGAHSQNLAGETLNWMAYFPQAGINFLGGVTLKF